MPKLKSVDALTEIARGGRVEGLADPAAQAFQEEAEARKEAFRMSVAAQDDDAIFQSLYEVPPLALSEDLKAAIVGDIRHKFGCADAKMLVVGSAQCGFSLAPKDDKPRYRLFTEASDIDIAVVDAGLFDRAWKETYAAAVATEGWRQKSRFEFFFFRGWIRPDLLPPEVGLQNEWFRGLREISGMRLASSHTISGGIYRDEYFMRSYANLAIQQCRAAELK